MYGIAFRVEAQPGKHEALRAFLQWDGEYAREQEPGTLRFEFYADPQDANAFYVYEAYRDAEAFEAHKRGEPFKRWNGGQREELGTNLKVLFIGDAAWSPV